MDKRAIAWAWVKKTMIRVLPRGRFVRSVAILAGGTALGQAVIILTSPVLTRLYTPEDFGVLAVYSSILSILSVIASLRYELAIPLPNKDEDAANLLALSLEIVLLMSLLVGIGTWLFGNQIIRWTNSPGFRPYLWLLPFGVGLVGIYQVFNYWAVRKQAFDRIARTKLNQGVGSVVTQMGLGIFKSSPFGLIIGQIVGQTVGITTLALLAYKKDKKALETICSSRARYMAARYRRFPLFSSNAALLNSFGLQLPVLLLSAFYGTQIVGQFALVQRCFGIPITLIGTSVSQVYLARAASEARTNAHGLQRLFFSVAKRLAALGLIPAIVLIVAGPFLFSHVFGSQWRQAGTFAQVMAIMFLIEFVAIPLSYTFSVLERQDLSLVWNAGRLLLSVSSIYLMYRLGRDAMHAVVAYSFAMLIGYSSLFLLSAYTIRSRVKSEEVQSS